MDLVFGDSEGTQISDDVSGDGEGTQISDAIVHEEEVYTESDNHDDCDFLEDPKQFASC